MCLFVNDYRTDYYKNKKSPILCYKVVEIDERGEFISPILKTKIKIDPDTLEFSINSSRRGKIEQSYNDPYSFFNHDRSVNKGIHAYVIKRKAVCGWVLKNSPIKRMIVRCWIHPKDILGVGDVYFGDITAKRIYFHPDDVGVVD